MDQSHDNDTTRCRRLGHDVRFGYCREENDGNPCRLILDCWWQSFDAQSFLRSQLTPEAYAALERAEPPNKVLSLVDLINLAKERSGSDDNQGDGPA